MSFPCDLCQEDCEPVTIVHIQDNGQNMEPNPLHPDAHYCIDCLQRLFDEHQAPCPICRARYRRPDYPGPRCAYRTTRKTKKLPKGYCEVMKTRLNAEDNKHYCDEHYDLGPAEMQLRVLQEQNAREEGLANKRKRLAEEQMKEKLRRQQANTLHKAALIYQQALDDAIGGAPTTTPATPASQ